jgi:NADH-quinone oxidoreductase subunit L
VVANWLRVADQKGIDGAIDATAAATVKVSQWDGKFDLGVVDGLVNLTANVIYGIGGWLRGFQTGSLRNYVLFLVLSAVAIFLILSYLFVSFAVAG